MKEISLIVLFMLLSILSNENVESSKKTSQVQRPYYYQYVKLRIPNHYKNKKIKWPRIRGRCDVVPDWKIDGINPIRQEARRGRTVVLFLMKRTCQVCYTILESLNDLARYYRTVNQPVSFIALNHRRQPLSMKTMQEYPMIKFYEEPAGINIFGSLRAQWRQVMIFDKCARQQYHFGFPYSWPGFPFTRAAIVNTLNFHKRLCGRCGVKRNTTAPPITQHTTRLPTTVKQTTVKPEDGPTM